MSGVERAEVGPSSMDRRCAQQARDGKHCLPSNTLQTLQCFVDRVFRSALRISACVHLTTGLECLLNHAVRRPFFLIFCALHGPGDEDGTGQVTSHDDGCVTADSTWSEVQVGYGRSPTVGIGGILQERLLHVEWDVVGAAPTWSCVMGTGGIC